MKGLRIKAYAKINLFLHVGPKREDGYHEIHTLLHLIELHDLLTIKISDSTKITCTDSAIPPEENLVTLALSKFSKKKEISPVEIHLEKNIPLQSGLGGGSSDAAATLNGINMLTGNSLTEDTLFSIARSIGADVPFFLARTPCAEARGFGEKIEPKPALERTPILIAKPKVGMSTAEAYTKLDFVRRLPRVCAEDCKEPSNDFDAIALPQSVELMEKLKELGAFESHLCGSGSAVYGLFDSEEMMQNAFRNLSTRGVWVWKGSTLSTLEEPEWML
ncbi:MAG TPA: 4-(cytidine 5'-diphospho)-2-C-methyl-D-erythritol kinase [Fimbriimonadales bacterium]|nr:4-(cytidine 5'-diphospho)-2-C-methyl-D-erythritol kinase [Fimbriimonadales bacterium]